MMRARSLWFFPLAMFVGVACAGQSGSTEGSKPKSAKKAEGCDNFAHPCSGEEACIDGSCRPKGCSSDSDCGSNSGCIEGWCIARQCQENLGCLGEDGIAGTDDDRSCIGGVCLPMQCPRDGKRCPAPGSERCNWTSDCGFGRICYNSTCVQARCAQDKDCLPRMCYAGLCFDQECNDRKPCKSGKTCVNGLCLTPGAATTSNSN
jgi:hypothetical protein